MRKLRSVYFQEIPKDGDYFNYQSISRIGLPRVTELSRAYGNCHSQFVHVSAPRKAVCVCESGRCRVGNSRNFVFLLVCGKSSCAPPPTDFPGNRRKRRRWIRWKWVRICTKLCVHAPCPEFVIRHWVETYRAEKRGEVRLISSCLRSWGDGETPQDLWKAPQPSRSPRPAVLRRATQYDDSGVDQKL